MIIDYLIYDFYALIVILKRPLIVEKLIREIKKWV